MDIEPESEDEDTIIERRRQLRQAIVQKYQQQPQPVTEVSSLATTPAPSEASAGGDSDAVGDEAVRELEETLHEAELKMKEEKEGSGSVGPAKMEATAAGKSDLEEKKSSLLAMKAAVRNADMFSEEDMFGEKKYLVSRVDMEQG